MPRSWLRSVTVSTMKTSWNHESEMYRYATTDDLPDFAEMLTDPEVGRWLWFTPIPPEGIEEFFKHTARKVGMSGEATI